MDWSWLFPVAGFFNMLSYVIGIIAGFLNDVLP